MSIFEAVRSVITNFKDFHGRARRSEFWWYYLFECIINFGLIYMMLWFLKDSVPGENQYGPTPKGL